MVDLMGHSDVGGKTFLCMIDELYAGMHSINEWMREDGARLDRIMLATDEAWDPADDEPDSSLHTRRPELVPKQYYLLNLSTTGAACCAGVILLFTQSLRSEYNHWSDS